LAAAATYLTLFVLEFGLALTTKQQKNPHLELQGMYTPDERLGYRLTPNWSGWYDDGLVQGHYRINSRGHRDDEPSKDNRRRVLLLGDSMTFGELLDQSATVDAQVERFSAGTVEAYNLGVLGYGPPAILETFHGADDIRGSDAFYLFFNNDLRWDNLRQDNGLTARRGYAVRKFKPDRTPYTQDELDAEIDRITTQPPLTARQRVLRIVKLHQIRQRCGHVVRTLGIAWNPAALGQVDRGEAMLLSGELDEFSDENIEQAVEYTTKMRDLANERGIRFHVVIIPSVGEARAAKYSMATQRYVDRVRNLDFDVIEPLSELTIDDYFSHNAHLNAHGANRTARAIWRSLSNLDVSAQSPPGAR
jgi:hypothetical protein